MFNLHFETNFGILRRQHYTIAGTALTSIILKLDKHAAQLAIRASNVDYKA